MTIAARCVLYTEFHEPPCRGQKILIWIKTILHRLQPVAVCFLLVFAHLSSVALNSVVVGTWQCVPIMNRKLPTISAVVWRHSVWLKHLRPITDGEFRKVCEEKFFKSHLFRCKENYLTLSLKTAVAIQLQQSILWSAIPDNGHKGRNM